MKHSSTTQLFSLLRPQWVSANQKVHIPVKQAYFRSKRCLEKRHEALGNAKAGIESAPKNLTFEHQPGSNAHIQQDRVLVWKTPRVQCCTNHRWGVFTKQKIRPTLGVFTKYSANILILLYRYHVKNFVASNKGYHCHDVLPDAIHQTRASAKSFGTSH